MRSRLARTGRRGRTCLWLHSASAGAADVFLKCSKMLSHLSEPWRGKAVGCFKKIQKEKHVNEN